MSIARFDSNGRYSEVVVHNGIIYLAGQTAEECGNDVLAQTQQVLQQIEDFLKAHNSGKDRILSAVIYLRDIRDYDRMNSVWDQWITPSHAPARACVEAKLADEDILVEISITAAQNP